MPELPEVETFARGLDASLKGRSILSVQLKREKNVLSPLEDFASSLEGHSIQAVSRRGKYLLFHLEGRLVLLSHLRMEGRWKVKPLEAPKEKHEILSLTLNDNRRLDYIDSRKFGTLEIKKEEDVFLTPPLSLLGPEPLEIDYESFKERLRSHKKGLKETLLDQTFVAGIGNIYADEICFASRLHPASSVLLLEESDIKILYQSMKDILNLAISCRGSSIHSYVPFGETSPASMQERLLVYGAAHKPCPHCSTPFTFTKIAGRGTTFCPLCQKKKGRPFLLGITGPIHAGKSSASAFFAEKGFAVFDADKEVKALYGKKEIQNLMKKVLGRKAMISHKVNTPYLRDLFSKDKAKKKEWESVLYPKLEEAFLSFYKEHLSSKGIVLDVPLLVSSPLLPYPDAILLLNSSEEVRFQRLENEGRDAKGLMKLNASYPILKSEKVATFEIKNEGDIPSLRKKLEKLYLTIQQAL